MSAICAVLWLDGQPVEAGMAAPVLAALAQSSEKHRAAVRPWQRNAYGLNLAAGARFAANTMDKAYLKPRALVSAPEELAVLDYRTITEPNVDSCLTMVAARAGRVDGIPVWFEAAIAEDLGYTRQGRRRSSTDRCSCRSMATRGWPRARG